MCIRWLKMASSVVGVTLQCCLRISRFMLTDICIVFMPYYVESRSAERTDWVTPILRTAKWNRLDVPMYHAWQMLTVLFCSSEQMVGRLTLMRQYVANRKVAGSNPYEVIAFWYLTNPSCHTMALVSAHLWQKWVTRIFLGGKGRPLRKADSLTVICVPIVWQIW
jgi:hypothetical protein